MKRLTCTLALMLALGASGAALAQNPTAPEPRAPEFIQFSPSQVVGALHRPMGEASGTAFLVAHRTSNFMNHIAARELSKRGHIVLGLNPRSVNNEAAVDWDTIALDIRQGVRHLRGLPGVERVVLIAHSGGGPSMSFYQAVAQEGASYCRGANKIVECAADALTGFEPTDLADGIVFLDAHPGNSVNALRSVNAAVTDEDAPFALDPALDPFREENGFNADGDSRYSAEFVDRYAQAQAARMNRLIDKALDMRRRMAAGERSPADDEVFPLYRNSARLSDFSSGVHGATLKPRKLLRNDGTIVEEIVRTVRVPLTGNREDDASFDGGTAALTLTSFLGANAIRATHALDGIDWCSSNNSVICAVERIRAPILVAAAQGHYFIRDGEMIAEAAASADKEFIVVEGMNHSLAPCTPCAEATGADYANATRNLFDHIAAWTEQRF